MGSRAAKDLGFEAPNVYGGLCCAYIAVGLKHEAYIIAREGVPRLPDDAGLYENYAETALDLGIFEQAQWAINEGLKLDPECEPLKKLQRRFMKDEFDDMTPEEIDQAFAAWLASMIEDEENGAAVMAGKDIA